MQFEVIKGCIDSESEELLQLVLKYTANIHGTASTEAAFLAALAETGKIYSLTKELPVSIVVNFYFYSFITQLELDLTSVLYYFSGSLHALVV